MAEQVIEPANNSHNSMKVYGILLFCVTCYASMFVFGTVLVESFHPVALTFFRLVFINAFLLVIGWRFIKSEKIPLKLLFVLAGAGFIGITISHLSLYTGLEHTDPITAALIYALGPLITSFITYFYLKERRRIYFWVGIIMGIFGVTLVVSKGNGFMLQAGKGELLIGVTILTYSIYLVIVEYLSRHLKPMVITVYTSVFGLVLVLPFLRAEYVAQTFQIDMKYWALLIVTAVLTNGFCTMLWNGAVRQVGASTSSIFLNMEPFAAMIIGYIVLQQIVEPIQLIGSIFIIAGVIMGTRFGKKTHTL
ncbi:DMT family transporter [Virgibacillus sp. W0181]|uniref:DMT family transporter n=1 Tax=Virgibacillus sp. W0181 TaxID=3391581 RepID=UPI003F489030